MRYANVRIRGLECVAGPDRVSSLEVEEAYHETLRRLGYRTGMLEMLTGVVARRLFPLDRSIASIAAEAAKLVLDASDFGVEEIDLVISTSVSRDAIEPSTASMVHSLLGLQPSAVSFDMGNACLGFLNAMEVAASWIDSKRIRTALIVAGENARRPLEGTVRRLQRHDTTEHDLRENLATLTLGSGGVALLLTHSDLSHGIARYHGGVMLAATQHNGLCRGWDDHMVTDAVGLLKAGVELGEKTWRRAQEVLHWSAEDLDHVMMHQVGAAHARAILKAIGVPPSKAYLTFPEFGNMGPAAIPITLREAWREGRLKEGDRIGLMGIGSGLNCALMEVVWS